MGITNAINHTLSHVMQDEEIGDPSLLMLSGSKSFRENVHTVPNIWEAEVEMHAPEIRQLSKQVDAPEFGRLVSPVLPVDGLHLLHVLAGDVEIEDLKVLLQPLHLGGLGDHHRVPLQTPAEDELRRRLAVLLSQALRIVL